ncbi:DUF3486 family protein [Hydrogenovibrio sp. 3SP14C1]|uniref:phage protein Gp27 family protein n=1 Tax=Hydrogenovibrio sp. 3SP14C1 TaxID=3038774 RepID=UPI002416EB41|nr:phage protein Gp27 family protein [Hydrogenovibrio sp. 3SP14C1]MDG4811690.1 DUF3486 family protein [Hydrogenovibrio sp. 3SP14C1]
MGRKSTVEKLPPEIKHQISAKVKTGASTILELTRWINKQGYNVSKSAVGRYLQKLQEDDSSQIFGASMQTNGGDAELQLLFDELKELKQREAEILALISGKVLVQ